jgi:hypothetical protein
MSQQPIETTKILNPSLREVADYLNQNPDILESVRMRQEQIKNGEDVPVETIQKLIRSEDLHQDSQT